MCQTIIISSRFSFYRYSVVPNIGQLSNKYILIDSILPDAIKSSLLLHLPAFTEIFQFYKTNKTADSCSQKSEMAKEFRTFAPIS